MPPHRIDLMLPPRTSRRFLIEFFLLYHGPRERIHPFNQRSEPAAAFAMSFSASRFKESNDVESSCFSTSFFTFVRLCDCLAPSIKPRACRLTQLPGESISGSREKAASPLELPASSPDTAFLLRPGGPLVAFFFSSTSSLLQRLPKRVKTSVLGCIQYAGISM